MQRVFFSSIRFLILLQVCLWSFATLALEDYDKILKSGLEHYDSKNYSESLVAWHTLLQSKKYSSSTEVLYNLALTEFKLKDYGSALGHFRRSQALNPLSYKTYRTLQLVKRTVETQNFYRVESENYFVVLLNWLPKWIFIALFIFPLACGTYNILRQNQINLSFWQFFKIYLLYLILSSIPVGLLYLQNQIQNQKFATLTGNKEIVIYSADSTDAAQLGALNIGDAFEVIKTTTSNKRWLGVSCSEIPFGWIKPDSYIVHRGKIDP